MTDESDIAHNKMLAAMNEYIKKKHEHEVACILQVNNKILANFERGKEQNINALNHIYIRIIQQLSLNRTEGEYDIIKYSSPAMIIILKEHFPTSEFTFYSNGDYFATPYDILRFKISATDIIRHQDVIDKHRGFIEKK